MSYKIFVRRAPKPFFMPEQQDNKKIGSYMGSGGSVGLGTLTGEEINEYMPQILRIPVTDNSFRAKVADYFRDIDIPVPEEGKIFEIDVDKEGKPINVIDFVHYKYCIGVPYVGRDFEHAESDKNIKYYIEDPQAAKREQIEEATAIRHLLMKVYEAPSETIKYVLLLCKQPVFAIKEPEEVYAAADLFIRRNRGNRELFQANWDTSDLKLKAWIHGAVLKGVLKEVGDVYFNGNQSLGRLESAVEWLKDPQNKETVEHLKVRYSQAEKLINPAIIR